MGKDSRAMNWVQEFGLVGERLYNLEVLIKTFWNRVSLVIFGNGGRIDRSYLGIESRETRK